MHRVILLLLLAVLTAGCPQGEVEGDEAGECDDGVDNDQDGLTDCADDECADATACAEADDDDAVADDDDVTDDDDSGADDDDSGTADDDDSADGDDDDSGDDDDDDSSACHDADLDGFEADSCGGEDCDDGNGDVNPSVGEVCFNEQDDDCDTETDELGCSDSDGWVMHRYEPLEAVPVDAAAQVNWGPAPVGGRDAVCVSAGSNHYLTLPHGTAVAAADRVAVQVDVYANAGAFDAVLQAALGAGATSYFRLRLWQDQNEAHLIEYNTSLGSNNELHTTSGYPSQQWHTLRVEFDRSNGDVAADVNGTPWWDGSAFLASLVGTELSLYGYGGDTGTNHVCFTDLSIWTDGAVGP